MKKETKEKKKRINWKRTFQNNGYMLGLIIKSCPGVLIMGIVSAVLGAANSFLLDTYLYKYALNALQEGKVLTEVLITIGCMLGYSVLYMIFRNILNCYKEIKHPIVEAYIQNLLQKKAVEVDLACFENSSFYDTYVKATAEATDRAFKVMNNLLDTIWVVIEVIAIGVLVITIDPIFLLLALLPLLCTLLVGKTSNRVRYEYNMRNQEVARQRDYVRRTFYLSDFSKEIRHAKIDLRTVGFRQNRTDARMYRSRYSQRCALLFADSRTTSIHQRTLFCRKAPKKRRPLF